MKAKLLIVFGIIVSIALAGVWASPNTGEASNFSPSQGPITFSTTATGANPDITTNFLVPTGANFTGQFGGAITFEDGAVAHAADAAIPDGAFIGDLQSVATLGLINSSCSSATPVNFNFVEATTSSATIITPSGPSTNLLANLAEDDGDLDNDGTVDVAAFAGNGIPDGADAMPDFVIDSLDPDGPGGLLPIVPRARYFGTAFVASSLIVILQFVVLNPSDGPGGAVDLTDIPGLSWADSSWGFPSATFLNNPLAAASNSAISDFCNFSSATFLHGVAQDNACTPVSGGEPAGCSQSGAGFTLRFGIDGGCPGSTTPNECGAARVTNPGSAQTVTWRQWAVSQRDWDQGASPPAAGDGIETNLDPCPIHFTAAGHPGHTGGDTHGSVDSWDPRLVGVQAEDSDLGGTGDGIPNTSTVGNGFSCDPTPASFSFDEDVDLWQNRLDNCPLLANGNFATTLATTVNATEITVAAASGAVNPVGFLVGDIISITEGANSDVGLVLTGVAGTTLTFANDPLVNAYTTAANVNQVTFAVNSGQFDLDVPPSAGGTGDNGPRTDIIGAPCDPNPNAPNGHYHATAILKHICIGGTDADGDGVCTTGSGINDPNDANTDSDGDGIVDGSDSCIDGANGPLAGFTQSQRDLNLDGFSDIGDIVLAAGKFGTAGGDPAAAAGYEGRLDLNYDRFVDIGDIVLLAGVFGSSC